MARRHFFLLCFLVTTTLPLFSVESFTHQIKLPHNHLSTLRLNQRQKTTPLNVHARWLEQDKQQSICHIRKYVTQGFNSMLELMKKTTLLSPTFLPLMKWKKFVSSHLYIIWISQWSLQSIVQNFINIISHFLHKIMIFLVAVADTIKSYVLSLG
mmetsp:Transcript_9943/g.13052  ORF Transcript_9943/g.13052 Transcript_9943/m.13052 type:complete len:155 (-) Transcript_9943:108-572(-)